MRLPSIFRRRFPNRPLATTRLRLECLEERTTPVTHINGFDAVTAAQGGTAVPDSDGAVGPSSFVAQANTAVGIYNKSTGAAIAGPVNVNNNTFFQPVRLANAFAGDPITVYNDITQRFFVADEDFNNDVLYVALSTSNNPTTLTTSSWNFFRFNTAQAGTTLADYPKVGYNAGGFVVSFNMFNGPTTFVHATVLAITNAGTTPGLVTVPAGGNGHFTMAPASMHSATAGGPMWFTEAASNGGSTITVDRMTNVFTASPTFTFTNLSVTSYGATVSPHEPAGQFTGNTNLGTRMYFSGLRTVTGTTHLVTAHTVGDGTGFSRIQWEDINVGGATPVLIQQGRINPGAGVDALFPDADINLSGAIGLQYMQTSPSQIPTIAITGRLATDALGTMQTRVLPHNTGSNIVPRGNPSLDRIGDYSMTSVDPTDGTFWGINEYGGPTGSPNWRTFVEHFSVGGGGGYPLNFTMSATDNNILVRNKPGDPAKVQIVNATTSAVLAVAQIASSESIGITGANVADTLTVTYQFGNPLPAGGLSFTHTAGGTDTLNVTDTSTTTAQSFSVTGSSVQRSGSAVISFTPDQISAVNVSGGSGANTYTVVNTEAGNPTTVNTGSGADTVNVLATTGPLTVNAQGGGGADVVNVGNAGSVTAITGALTLNNGSSWSQVNINDGADNADHPNVMLTATSLTGLAPATINLQANSLDGLMVTVGNGTNTYTIVTTPSSGAPGGDPTVLTPGNGADTVNVQGTDGTAPLTVNNAGSNNQIDNLGSGGTLTGLSGAVTLNNTPNFTVVNVNDGSDNGNHPAVALSATALTGLAPAAINFQINSLRALNLTVGNGTDRYAITGTQNPANGTTLTTGTGTNTVTVTGTGGSLTLTGNPAGTNTLVGPNATTTWAVTGANAGSFSGGGAAAGFTNYQSLTGGTGSNTFVFGDGASVSGTLNGGIGGTNTLDTSAYTTPEAYYIYGTDAGVGTAASFIGIQTLIGGAGGNNDFQLVDGGSLSVGLNGGAGFGNTLDYTLGWSTNVIVDLQTGAASGVAGQAAGAVSNIQDALGASGNGAGVYNLLIGSSVGGNYLQGGTGERNILVAGGSASTLVAGDGEDLVILGTTGYDTDPALTGWQLIAAYWTGSDDFNTRSSNLQAGTGVPTLDPTAGTGTVFGNNGGNTVTGSGAVALVFTDNADNISGIDFTNSRFVTITP